MNDISSMYIYINEIYNEMTKYKTDCKNLATQLFTFTNKLNEIEREFYKFKTDIAGSVLGNELNIDKLKEKKDSILDKLNRRIDKNATNIGKVTNFENVKNRLDSDIALANKKIEKNIEILENISQEIHILPTQ